MSTCAVKKRMNDDSNQHGLHECIHDGSMPYFSGLFFTSLLELCGNNTGGEGGILHLRVGRLF